MARSAANFDAVLEPLLLEIANEDIDADLPAAGALKLPPTRASCASMVTCAKAGAAIARPIAKPIATRKTRRMMISKT
jgi:hypothetical protein